MIRVALALACVTGCRIDFDEVDAGTDAPASDAAALTGCWPSWFAGTLTADAPVDVPGLPTTMLLDTPSLLPDGLTLYYARFITDDDLYVATRATQADPWTEVGPVAELDGATNDTSVSFSGDRLFAVFASDRTAGDGYDLFAATRTDPAAAFGTPDAAPFAAINTAQLEDFPACSRDGLRVYFTRGIAGSTMSLTMTSRASRADAFGPPVDLLELDVDNLDRTAVLSPDERIIVFAKGAAAPTALYYARRAAIGDAFGAPILIPTIDGPTASEVAGALSEDGCELYFSSDVTGIRHLFVARLH